MVPGAACFLLGLSTVAAFTFPDVSGIFFSSAGSSPREGRKAGSLIIKPCPGGALWCECPNGTVTCDEIDDYPTAITVDEQVGAVDFIKARIFREPEQENNLLFGGATPVKPSLPKGVSARFGEESSFVQESRACDHRKSTVRPKKARNVDGAFVFVVNDEKYQQAVDIEQCLGEGEPCRNQEDSPSFGSTVCRQKYTTYKMYVINPEGDQVYDTFSLPSACICHHRSNFAIRHLFDNGLAAPELPNCPKAEKLALARTFAHSFSSTPSPAPVALVPARPPVEPLAPPQSSDGSPIRFKDRKKRQIGFKKLGCENNANFCEEEQDYPGTLVRSALRQHPVMSDSLFQQLFASRCKDQQIQTRGFNIDEEQLCYGRTNIIFPKKAKNLKDEWRFVVNIDNYTQSVEVEECDNGTVSEDNFGRERHDSSDFGVCLYSGSTGNDPDLTVCRQLYTEHKLLSLDPSGQLEVDSFKLPSACACFVREDYILEFRGGMKAEDSGEDTVTLPKQVQEVTDAPFSFGSGK